MLTDEGISLIYINIFLGLSTRIAHAFFLRNLSLDTFAVTKCKNSIQPHSYHLAKRCDNPPVTREIKL